VAFQIGASRSGCGTEAVTRTQPYTNSMKSPAMCLCGLHLWEDGKETVSICFVFLLCNSTLELIHSDIAGPIDLKSLGRAQYILIFTDDVTRYRVGYLLKCKSEAFTSFKEYKALLSRSSKGRQLESFAQTEEGNIHQISFVISCCRTE